MSYAQFPEPKEVGPREWGKEILVAHAPGKYTLKRIWMRRGSKGGLQKHHKKDEAGYVTSGQLAVVYDDGKGNLTSKTCHMGDAFRFEPGTVHQIVALTDCEYIEASTPHFNDRVHMEAEYGIEEEAGGLPTTEIEDVEVR